MAAVSQSQLNMAGSHCGVSIGEDGPSQMALEDIAAFRFLSLVIFLCFPSQLFVIILKQELIFKPF